MIRYLLIIILLICSVNAHSISWVEQLGLKERSVGPDTTDRLGQLWVEGTSKDLMYKDSGGNDYNILLGGGIGGAQLDDLSDVDTYTASPTAGQFLKYNGSLWVPGDIPIINALDDVGDVNVASATEGQVLTRIGSQWQAKDASGGASFAGAVTVPSITDNGNGSVTVGAIDVVLFDNATQVGTARKYSLPSLTVTLIDGSTNYIIADYASGSPALANTTNVGLINESSVVPIYTIYRSGTFLHIQSWDSLGNGLANKLHQSIVKTQRYRRESGLALGETGTRNITLGSGIVWTGANSVSLSSISTATDNLFYFLRTGASSWTTQVVTQYNNTNYWNGTTTASLTNNRYAVNWVYRGVESQKHIYVVLGEGDYTLPQAQASQPPANLPSHITSHAILVGRIIIVKSAATATQIDSAFNVVFSGSSASDHNSLTGLQGGTTGEYYHLTSAGKTAADTLTGTANYVSKFTGTGLTASQIFDNGVSVGIGTSNPTSKLTIVGGINGTETVTSTAGGSLSPNLFTVNINPASTSSTEVRALGFSATTQGASALANIRGGYFEVRNTGSGTITSATGIYSTGMVFPSTAQNFGTIGEVASFLAVPINSFSNTVTGTISNARGLRINNAGLTANQVITNQLGISVDALTSGTNNTHVLLGTTAAPTGNWGIYNASASNNYFNGNIGVGATTATTKLYVTGDSTVTGYQYFGDPATNGSFRMYVSGGALLIEKRISGTWTSVGKFDEL